MTPPRLKHETISDELEREIRAGTYELGSQLPGETALAERFAVSRNTVRAALLELGRAGFITTRSGKGSFVTFDGRALDVRLGWARALRDHGVDATVEVLRVETIVDEALAAELGLDSERFVVVERRRRLADGPAISHELSRLPATDQVCDVVTAERASGSLTDLMHKTGLIAATGEQWVEVRALDERESGILSRPVGESFLWSRCVTRNAAGRAVECVESYLDPAHFRLHFQFASELP